MTDRGWRPSDVDLEQALRELAPALDLPPTPPLAARVGARLRAQPASIPDRRPAGQSPVDPLSPLARHPSTSRSSRPISPLARALALAAALLLALLVLVATPAGRTLADRLGLPGIAIGRVPFVPVPTPAPTSTPVGQRLGLGSPASPADLVAPRVSFRILTSDASELGPPDELYLADSPPGGRVSFVYRARPDLPAAAETGVGLLLTEFAGRVEGPFLQKGVGPGTRLEPVQVGGSAGFWLEGEPHTLLALDAGGQVLTEQLRLATNTLLWERDGVVLRLEASIPRDRALQLAAAIR